VVCNEPDELPSRTKPFALAVIKFEPALDTKEPFPLKTKFWKSIVVPLFTVKIPEPVPKPTLLVN
jgi:hypothetical protein